MMKWEDLPGISTQCNSLMRQNWGLLSDAEDLLSSDDVDVDELQDIFREMCAIEDRFQETRTADVVSVILQQNEAIIEEGEARAAEEGRSAAGR